jgi:predicted GH43/DUF377 family glycosyl hydrolase
LAVLGAATLASGALAGVPTAAPAGTPLGRWTEERAWEWCRQRPWLVGVNYVPSSAANTTEWWQKQTFDPATIGRELGWAQGLGFNTVRAFLQYLVWRDDPTGLAERLDIFLDLASKHGLWVMPVLFDDCAFGDPPQLDPALGTQREPIPGMILPSWTPSPGQRLAADPAEQPRLRQYVLELMRRFGQDPRIVAWDLFNEPLNSAGTGQPAWLRQLFAWAREATPSQPLTIGVWNDNREVNQVALVESDILSYHRYCDYAGQRQAIGQWKAYGRPVVCTEWMARPQGSRWATDLPLFRSEGVGCYAWGLVNGRTQCQFAWYHKRGTPEPAVWFHDLFHGDGRPYDAAEHAVIRQTTAATTLDWAAVDFRYPQTPAPAAAGSVPLRPCMLYGDATRHGRPFAKDPCVVRVGDRYLLYYSMAPASDPAKPKGWAIGIAESQDLVNWTKVGEILPEQECERNGIVNGKALWLDGKLHLFYNTYGNGRQDALCHAVSTDGLAFQRNPGNPILRARGDWNAGRAIDCDAFEHGDQLVLLFATRDPTMTDQLLVAAAAPRRSDFGPGAWRQLGDGPVLRPELPWETHCIEAPSVIRRGDRLFLFYGGGYNNDPQQIGCAVSTDAVHWTRLFREPLIPNGQPGDWNSSETGHPGVFAAADGRTFLFVQGNNDKGKTWFLSCYELTWQDDLPAVLWESAICPAKRPGPAAHSEDGIAFSSGWTCWRGAGPRNGGLHYANTAGARATIEFRGSRLSLVHKVGPDCGVAELRIDDRPLVPTAGGPFTVGPDGTSLLDTYAPAVEWEREAVLATDLAPGPHLLTITATGRGTRASSDAYVQIVAVRAH